MEGIGGFLLWGGYAILLRNMGVPSFANLWGATLLDKNKTIHRRVIIGVFVGLAPGLSCPWQHCCIAAHLWVVQMEVDMFFFFLVFWSLGFRVGFHAPLLVARMGGVSLSLHVLRVS